MYVCECVSPSYIKYGAGQCVKAASKPSVSKILQLCRRIHDGERGRKAAGSRRGNEQEGRGAGGAEGEGGEGGLRGLLQGCRQPQLGPRRRSLLISASQADRHQQSYQRRDGRTVRWQKSWPRLQCPIQQPAGHTQSSAYPCHSRSLHIIIKELDTLFSTKCCHTCSCCHKGLQLLIKCR